MARYLLCGASETVFAVVAQILNGRLIWTAYFERPAVKAQNRQFIKPCAAVHRVKRFYTLNYVRENVFNFLCCHATILYESMLHANSN